MFRYLLGVCFFLFVGAAVTQAVPVDPNGPNGIAAIQWWDGGCNILMTTGQVSTVYASNEGVVCLSRSDWAPPVPLSEITDWHALQFITRDNQFWWFDTSSGTGWHSGNIPCLQLPIPTENKTWGGVKGKYDGNK